MFVVELNICTQPNKQNLGDQMIQTRATKPVRNPIAQGTRWFASPFDIGVVVVVVAYGGSTEDGKTK